MNIIGLDVGEKRIGVALFSDNLVVPLVIIEATDLPVLISKIGHLCRQKKIEKIVIGIPKNSDTFQADRIHKFAIELTKSLNIEVDYTDETLTSKEAESQLKAGGLNPKTKKFKEEVDKLSAKLILEQYLREK